MSCRRKLSWPASDRRTTMNDRANPAVPAAKSVPPAVRAPLPASRELYCRHALPVRIMHWINVVALTILFMSGLQIFNAHPGALLGQVVVHRRPPVLEIGARQGGERRAVGVTRDLRPRIRHDRRARRVDAADGRLIRAARFPSWMTIPEPSVAVDGARAGTSSSRGCS